MKNKTLAKTSSKSVGDVAFNELLPSLTAIATLGPKGIAKELSTAIQDTRTLGVMKALTDGYERLKQQGRSKNDYHSSHQAQNNFLLIVSGIQDERVSQEQLDAQVRIFLNAASEEISNREDPLPNILTKLVLEMSPGELQVLGTLERLKRSGKGLDELTRHQSAAVWMRAVAEESDLKEEALVELFEEDLMQKKLISGRSNTDRSGIHMTPDYRMTGLGHRLCAFLHDPFQRGTKTKEAKEK